MSDKQWKLKICCMGAGYVGGPTMAVIAKQCPDVSVECQEGASETSFTSISNILSAHLVRFRFCADSRMRC